MNKKNIDKVIDDNFVILIDTREKVNSHIIDAFDKYNIKYKKQKLDYGDYGCIITKNEDLGILDDIILKVAVERKNGLEEIGNNLTNAKERFHREMQRCIDDNGAMVIMIENCTYDDIANKKYNNKITPKSFLALLHSIYSKYDIPFIFISKDKAPLFIYDVCKYFTKEYLKNK